MSLRNERRSFHKRLCGLGEWKTEKKLTAQVLANADNPIGILKALRRGN